MISRRGIVQTLIAIPAIILGRESKVHAKKQTEKTVVFSGNAVKRFEEVLLEGGEITSITVHYDLPAPPGRFSRGSSCLSKTRDECSFRIES